MSQNPPNLIRTHDDCYPIHECRSSFAPSINSASHSQAAMINYSIPLLRVPNRSRNPLLLSNYMLTCFPYNFDGHEQHRHEGKWQAKPKQTRQLSELVLVLTSQHVTARLSLVSLLARFCIPPEVKFHVFRQLNREEKSILKIFFDFLIRTSCRFKQANKKNLLYTLK